MTVKKTAAPEGKPATTPARPQKSSAARPKKAAAQTQEPGPDIVSAPKKKPAAGAKPKPVSGQPLPAKAIQRAQTVIEPTPEPHPTSGPAPSLQPLTEPAPGPDFITDSMAGPEPQPQSVWRRMWNRKVLGFRLKSMVMVITGIILIPVIVWALCIWPSFVPMAGGPSDWIMFFGSFLGALLTGGITFFVLYHTIRQNEANRLQNERENLQNRELQMSILRYEEQKAWLERLTEIVNDSTKHMNMLKSLIIDYCSPFEERYDPNATKEIKNTSEYLMHIVSCLISHLTIAKNVTNDSLDMASLINKKVGQIGRLWLMYSYTCRLYEINPNMDFDDLLPKLYNRKVEFDFSKLLEDIKKSKKTGLKDKIRILLDNVYEEIDSLDPYADYMELLRNERYRSVI